MGGQGLPCTLVNVETALSADLISWLIFKRFDPNSVTSCGNDLVVPLQPDGVFIAEPSPISDDLKVYNCHVSHGKDAGVGCSCPPVQPLAHTTSLI